MQEVGGSIPPSSTRFSGLAGLGVASMNRLGRYAIYFGIVLSVAGLIVGFTAMFEDSDSAAVNWLGFVPIGFLIMLVGTVVSQLHNPDDEK